MICKKAMKIAMGVGMVLCATASFAGVTNSFDTATTGAMSIDGWFGNGTVEVGNPSYAKPVGAPIATTSNPSINTLLVEGEVICSNAVSGTSSVSDFLIFIPEPSDELGTDELEGAKVAIAAGTNWVDQAETKVKLCLYCKDGENAAAWHEIAEVTTSTWLRVTLAFKDDRCRVSLDGEPVHNNFGYKTSTDTSTGGAWYKLAGSGNSVQSLSFIGCAKLDDVVIKDSFAEDAFPATAVAKLDPEVPGSETVRYNDLNKWGWTVADLNGKLDDLVANTGMTIGEKLECGLDPTTDTKFEPVSITKTSAAEATITFPCDDPTKTGRYKIEITGGNCNSATVVTGATTDGCEAGRAKITLTGLTQTAPVMTFKLVAEK